MSIELHDVINSHAIAFLLGVLITVAVWGFWSMHQTDKETDRLRRDLELGELAASLSESAERTIKSLMERGSKYDDTT